MDSPVVSVCFSVYWVYISIISECISGLIGRNEKKTNWHWKRGKFRKYFNKTKINEPNIAVFVGFLKRIRC